jgi:hypothetical protein
MTKRNTVLKDFSALKVEKRIELSAIGIYQIVFKAEQERAFEPRKGTVLHSVWQAQKMDMRQQRAWKRFRDDVDAALGKSGGVTSSYGDYHDGGDSSDRVPTAHTNKAYQRVQDILQRHLGRREKTLLHDLLQNDLTSNTELKLEFIGLLRSGYADERDAKTAGVVQIQCLLDKISDFYGF